MFEKVDNTYTYIHTDAYLFYKLTTKSSGELKSPVAGGIDYVRYLSMQKVNELASIVPREVAEEL